MRLAGGHSYWSADIATGQSRLKPGSSSFEQRERRGLRAGQLIHPALPGRLIRAPAEKPGPVPESAAGKMIVLDFQHEFGRQWLPLPRALCAPAAWSARCLTGKSWRLDQFLESRSQLLFLLCGEA